jgi:hypothetical protein
MPYSITTKDGITIRNIPDDVDPNSQELRDRVAKLRASGGERSITQEIGRQVGLTARAGVEGLAGLAGIVTDPVAALVNQALPQDMQIMPLQQSASALLTAAGVPQPQNAQERIVQQAAQALAAGGGSVGLARGIAGVAASPVTREVARQMAAQPVQQLAGSAGAGLAGQVAQEEGAGPVGQLAASLAGGVAGAGLAGMRTVPRVDSAQAGADIQAAKRAGVDLMTSDVIPPRTFVGRTAQQAGERIPLAGTGAVRGGQQAQRIEAVKTVLREFGADDAANASDKVMADLARKRSAELGKYSRMKSDVLQSADQFGPVQVGRATQAIDDQIAKQQAIGTRQSEAVVSVLEDFKQAAQGKPMTVLDAVRSQIGKAFDGQDMATIKDAGTKALQAVYGPLRQDMDDHIRRFGARRDINKWQVANKRLSEMAGEIESTTLRSVLRSGDVKPEVVNRMLFSKSPSEVKALYSGLTPQGRANARTAIIAKAADEAGGMAEISPDRFANSIKKMGDQVGVFFAGDDLAAVEGLARTLQITKRAGEAAAAPPTGVQVAVPLGFGVLVDALGSMGAATTGAVTIGGIARLYESPAVRNLLIKMPKVKRGSAEEAALVKRIVSTIQSQSEQLKQAADDQQSGKF